MVINTLDNAIDTSTLLNTEIFERNFPGKLKDKSVYGFIYKITNKTNGKIYIGKTKDVKRRAREYISFSKRSNPTKHRDITDIMLDEGLDNFVMEPIDFAENKDDLKIKELNYILSYNATDPSIGYNTSVQSVITPSHINQRARVQYADELMKRSKIICCINIKTRYMLFSTGLKLFGDTISRHKDEIKSAARRCATIDDFMIYYMNNNDYTAQLNFILDRFDKNKNVYGNTIHPSIFMKYREYIMNYINNNENPEGFLIRFIHQSDDTECKYEYETDLTDLRNFCKTQMSIN